MPISHARDHTGAATSRRTTLLSALTGIFALRLLALYLNRTDLFVDEAQYWSWSLTPAFGYYSKPPLIGWLIAGARWIGGDSEFCIRFPSLICHMMTAALIYPIGKRLYGETTGFWSAVVYATLPGVSVSAGVISTDAPLLTCWALALLAFIELLEAPSWPAAAVLGLALGIGLNAKYAMAYFILGIAVFLIVAPSRRTALRDSRLWAALAIGFLLIVPNLVWNATTGFVTFAHTAEKSHWGRVPLHPLEAVQFVLFQFGVFGPLFFAALLSFLWRKRRSYRALAEADRLLLAFTLPVLIIILLQALLFHAQANWTAVSYVSATVLVTSVLLRERANRWFRAGLGLNIAIAVLIGMATWQAGNFALPWIGDPLARSLGNRELAAEVRAELAAATAAAQPFRAIASDERKVTAALLYYLRDADLPIRAWRRGGRPRDEFELSRPFVPGTPEPVLMVSTKDRLFGVREHFREVVALRTRQTAAGRFESHPLHLYRLSGYAP